MLRLLSQSPRLSVPRNATSTACADHATKHCVSSASMKWQSSSPHWLRAVDSTVERLSYDKLLATANDNAVCHSNSLVNNEAAVNCPVDSVSSCWRRSAASPRVASPAFRAMRLSAVG